MVGKLIAGISILDACMLGIMGHAAWAIAAVFAFFATRRMQRRIPGT
jgi:hypothetical protein